MFCTVDRLDRYFAELNDKRKICLLVGKKSLTCNFKINVKLSSDLLKIRTKQFGKFEKIFRHFVENSRVFFLPCKKEDVIKKFNRIVRILVVKPILHETLNEKNFEN